MATVYLAEDRKYGRQVAVKVLKTEFGSVLGAERFLREIEVSARLTHPHILPLHDSGESDGLLYYVMPYVAGESLRDRLRRERQLPLHDALQIARDVAEALSYAHDRGVIHRDIKPANILLQSGQAFVADFGIARALSAAGGDKLTETGLAIGTPAYMSPEQASGDSEVDGRSDLYALGCVLYEMLAGQPPFTGTAESLLLQHLTAEPLNITAVRPAVPARVAAALDCALAKTPADRFSTLAQFADAITPREAAGVIPASPWPATSRPARRTWLRPALFGIAALALLSLMSTATGSSVARWLHTAPVAPLIAQEQERIGIAVMPFQNLSAQDTHAYFAGGLHDELLNQLARVAALKVISRTSVASYQGTAKPVRQIASELGVRSVVEGTVQVVGSRLRVNVHLIDAGTDEHLWSEKYDRTLDDAFAIQSDVAQQVVAAVGARLGASERERLAQSPTGNAEAYRIFLQGREYHRRPGRARQDLESAQQLYERALALDGDFALAQAELSQVHGLMYWLRYDPSRERIARQLEAAEEALRLTPRLPEAHLAIGLAHYYGRRDYAAALSEFEVALQFKPSDALLWAQVGYANRRLGNWTDVYAALERAVQLDPRDASLFFDLGGHSYRFTRRYADAVQSYDRALALAPDLRAASVRKGLTYVLWRGELDTLRAVLERLPLEADLADLGLAAAQRATLLLIERQADSLLALLRSLRPKVLEGTDFFLPTSLYAGWAHQLREDRAAAKAAFESALVHLDTAAADMADDWRVHAARGLALAGLGRQEAALREARWLEQSAIYRDDAVQGTWLAEERARVLAQAGAASAALDEIERLLEGPSNLSIHSLRLDPRWDPIRGHPRYAALLARHAPTYSSR